jgi:hypothetical protein
VEQQAIAAKYIDCCNATGAATNGMALMTITVNLVFVGGKVCAMRVVSLLAEISSVHSRALRGDADREFGP